MRILVDGDNSSRIKQVEKIAKSFHVPVILFCDVSRELNSSYSDVVYCDISYDSTDIKLFNQCEKGDIVITSDIGLAGIILAKGARVLHGSGRILSNRGIDQEIARRAMMRKMRRVTKHASQARKVDFGVGKDQTYSFGQNLVQLIKESRKEGKDNENDSCDRQGADQSASGYDTDYGFAGGYV